MKNFLFTKFNYNHFFFLSYFIIHVIKAIINKIDNPTNDIAETFNYYYVYTLSDFLSIIPVLIIKKRSRSSRIKEINTKEVSSKEELIYIDANAENRSKKTKTLIKILLIISFMEFLAIYTKVFYYIIIMESNLNINKFSLNSVIIFSIIFQYICNRIILHYLFYRHHYLSLVINIIFLIILCAYDIVKINESNNNAIEYFLYITTKILSIIFYSIEDAYAKIILTYNSISPYHFLLYRGIIVNFLVLIVSIVLIFVELPDENGVNSCIYTRFWKIYDNKLNILRVVGLYIINYLFQVNLFFIIDKFTSSHLAMTQIIGYLGDLLISPFYEKKMGVLEFFLRLISYFILIIAASIHNEFIVLNFCKFQKNTKLYLQKLSELDIEQTDYNITISENILNENTDDNRQSENEIQLIKRNMGEEENNDE